MSKVPIIILTILFIGILYRLLLTANGNFFFNMDNGRDMVDVREMVVLGKLRLIGPTSAIEGFYNGPAWYYLLSIPFILSDGHPYAPIIMEIILWAIGGFFLLKLTSKWGSWLTIPIGSIWIASDYIVLANRYAFNPNPVALLTPLFIYLTYKYIETGHAIFSIFAFLLGGLFFNFEMNIGAFIPLIIITSLTLSRKSHLMKTKSFWLGVIAFILTLMPQVIFDIKHGYLMSKSVVNYLMSGNHPQINFVLRFQKVATAFYEVFKPMLMHKQFLTWIIFGLIILLVLGWRRNIFKNILVLICLVLILVPFLGYLILPVNVNLWHLGAEAAAFLLLVGFVIKSVWDKNLSGKMFALGLGLTITLFSLLNVINVFSTEIGKPSSDPSLFRNEMAVIDYIYRYAQGQNFKVYTYLPSVYDYPYQYLFWWAGLKKYGYIPGEYAYSPNKPQYISNKEKFEGRQDNFSGIVFLIKEPDRINLRQAWENDFEAMEFISKDMIGPLEIEVRKEKLF